MTKRLLSCIVTTAILISAAPQHNFAADGLPDYTDRPVYVREYNVAHNKPLTVSDPECFKYGNDTVKSLSSAVDDDWKTEVVTEIDNAATGATEHDHWLTVDLQKRYVINNVQIAARYGGGAVGWQSGYEIQASNDENFVTYDVLDAITADNALTTNLNASSGNINVYRGSENNEAYRYVRLFAANHCMGISELKVFANQTLTDISTGNKTAVGTRTSNDLQTSTALFRAANIWNGGSTGYPWMRVDLGAEYPVGAIELTGFGTDPRTRQQAAIYGSNVESTVTTDEKEPFADTALANQTAAALYDNNPEHTELTDIKGNAAYANGYQEFPAPASDGSAFMKASVQDTASFRYITYKKTGAKHPTMLSNMRIMVVNPVLNRYGFDISHKKKIVLEFSDEMDESSIYNIKLESRNLLSAQSENACLPYTVEQNDAYTYTVVMDEYSYGDEITLKTDGVVSTKGVPLKNLGDDLKEKTIKLTTKSALELDASWRNASGYPISGIENESVVTAQVRFANNMDIGSTAKNPSVILVNALFDADNTMVASSEAMGTCEPGESKTLSAPIDLAAYKSNNGLSDLSGYTARCFVWKDFFEMTPWVFVEELFCN